VDVSTFCSLAEALTGTLVNQPTEQDKLFLQGILSDDNRSIDCSQLNELLLIVNKDRIELPFFSYFFDAGCTVSLLEERIKRFQKTAMLRYGNFIFAYRILSRIKTDEEFRNELGDQCKTPEEKLKKYKIRSPKLLDVEPIPKENTPLVGYLSAGEIIAELERAELFEK
jgi:hypothetical protein